jgi:hypothetical protein
MEEEQYLQCNQKGIAGAGEAVIGGTPSLNTD